MRGQHLILYDRTCSLRQKAVMRIIEQDSKALFLFAPLTGDTAKKVLNDNFKFYKDQNTLLLIEDFKKGGKKIYIRSRAIFHIYLILHGKSKIWGTFFFLIS